MAGALLALGCGGGAEPVATRAQVAVGTLGVTMSLPEGAVVAMEAADRARVRVDDLPELVVTRAENTTGMVLDQTLGRGGRVTVIRAGRESKWTCEADQVSDALVNRVEALCASLRPPDAPAVSELRCRDGRGKVDEAREAWLRERAGPIVACYAAELARAPTLRQGVFVLAAEHEGGARTREQHGFSAPGHTVSDAACFERATAGLEADAGYAPAAGAGRFKCTVQLSRY
ncbi:MAG: hypothetical protein IT385_02370 [Deltaproteobacteria bacterium]|nr:hypothetical protein [Deltaproteobacteria bacterium]